MKANSSLLVLIAFFLNPQTLFAYQCLIVSGFNHEDEIGEHAPQVLHELHPIHANHFGEIAGSKCKYYDSWKKLLKYAEGSSKGVPNVKTGEPLIVGQIAHGHSGGVASTNSGEVPGQEILKNLNHLARNRPVFSPIFSCYSGDLIAKKLIDDEINPEDPAIDNLCLLTGSAFNRGAEGGNQDIISILESKNVSRKNPEDVFLMADEGLISSAPWSSSGFTAYLVGKQASDAMKVVRSIHSTGAFCPTHESALKSSQISLSLREDDFTNSLLSVLESNLKNLAELPSKEVDAWVKLDDQINNISVNINTFSKLLSQFEHRRQEIEIIIECLQFVLEKLKTLKSGMITDLKIKDFNKISNELKKTAAFNNLMKIRGRALPYVIQDLGRLDFEGSVSDRETYPIYSISPNGFALLEKSQRFLAELMEKSEWNEIWLSKMDDNHIVSFESERIPLRQKLLLSEILGQSQYIQSDRDIHRPHDHLSPVKALYGFVRGGVVVPDESLSDPQDRRRRSACRKFQF
jgi:hypothetical protein